MNVTNHPPEIILIDDDPLQHLICKKILSNVGFNGDFRSYFTGLEGINHVLTQNHTRSEHPNTIVFLDLNMPIMDGWEFLRRFKKLEQRIKSNYSIYILTSSILNSERKNAASYKEVLGYFQKPLLTEYLDWIFQDFKKARSLGTILNTVLK